MKNPFYEYAAVSKPPAFKDADLKKGVTTGYLAAFNIPDAGKDVILPGAFRKTIRELGPTSERPRIKYLLDHATNKVIGKFTELKEDKYGLYYEAQVGSHNLGQDFIKMVESGLITEHSIGYDTIQFNKKAEWDDYKAPVIRELVQLKLYEGSALQFWAMNEHTPLLALKDATTQNQFLKQFEERMEATEKFIRNSTATDETLELLSLELKQLGALVYNLATNNTPAAEKAQEPPTGEDDSAALELALENLKLSLLTR